VSPRGPHGGPPRCNRATSPRATGDCRRLLLVYPGINLVPYHGPSGRLGSEEERAMRGGGADWVELERTDDVATLGARGRTPAHLVRRARSRLRVAAGRRSDALARAFAHRPGGRGLVAHPLCAGRAGRHRARRAALHGSARTLAPVVGRYLHPPEPAVEATLSIWPPFIRTSVTMASGGEPSSRRSEQHAQRCGAASAAARPRRRCVAWASAREPSTRERTPLYWDERQEDWSSAALSDGRLPDAQALPWGRGPRQASGEPGTPPGGRSRKTRPSRPLRAPRPAAGLFPRRSQHPCLDKCCCVSLLRTLASSTRYWPCLP